MIIRYNCFETNSSSTHALCMGKEKLEEPYVLINRFLTDKYCCESDTIEKENKYCKLINNKKYNKKWEDEPWRFKKEILLRRFQNLGREFDIFDSSESKLNFIWTCLVSNYNFKNDFNSKEMFYKFLEYLYSLGIKIRFLDIVVKSNDEGNVLIKLNDNKILPDNLKNKYLCGKETYGYFPMKELSKILKNPKLFWNLVFGNSKIYTGSDENGSFEDLNFKNYKFVLVGGSDSKNCQSENIFEFKDEDKIGEYKNGNYITKIYSNGTRTRELFPKETFYEQGLFKEELFNVKEIDLMNPEFPESIDLKITNYCNNGCKYCYANSDEEGLHADKDFIKEIISQMKPFTEIALGGGNTISYPYLDEILKFAKNKNVICNMTLKDIDVIMNHKRIQEMYHSGLIKSIGISPTNIEFLSKATELVSNTDFIIHFVLGIHNKEFLDKVLNDNFKVFIEKILILGYKEIGKGKNYFDKNSEEIKNNIKELKDYINNEVIPEFSVSYKTISFDNLAIKQLELDINNVYKDLYQGEDGKFSFYIDAVKEKYARSSLEEKQDYFFNIHDAFDDIKKGR